MAETSSSPPPNPNPNPKQPPSRDFLLHLEAYLSRRDGVDKLLKISRYAARIALSSGAVSSSSAAGRRLKSFESSVGLSRKAFRLGKFVQDINSLRSAAASSTADEILLAAVSYGGEGFYYFVEQFVWLARAGLLPADLLPRLQKASAWAELVGYLGSILLKLKEVKKIEYLIDSALRDETKNLDLRKLREKLLLKRLSIAQDFADGLMALADVRDGKGRLTSPTLLASAGLVSALISMHKNWIACC